MRIHFILAMPILLATIGAAHAGDYYKWTDPNGAVHYSQTPPPGHASKSVYVNDGTQTLPLPGMNPVPQTAEQKAKTQSQQAALKQVNAHAISANCATAEQNIAKLESGKAVGRPKDNTDVRVLDRQQREQALADARAQVATYCTSGQR